ncbi:MAG TPA: PAS domain S-box protein, partial [Candidatus Cloacimonadota bacterium]|nr:PAS domain S-box protein [Candidatus Cloacimonadota bacterium]
MKENERVVNESVYKLLFNEAPIAYQALDETGCILEVNNIWLEKLNYERTEVLGQWFGDFLPPYYAERFSEYFANITTSTDLIKGLKISLLRKDGSSIKASLSARMNFDENGDFQQAYCVFEDITEKRRIKEINLVLNRILEAVLKTQDLPELIAYIHQEVATLINAKNFFVALYNPQEDMLEFPYHRDEKVALEHFPAAHTFSKYVIKTGKPLFADEPIMKSLLEKAEIIAMDENNKSKIWIGIPLKIDDKVIGVVSVQSYDDPAAYSREDLRLLEFISETISLAIDRKQKEDALRLNEEKFHSLYNNTLIGLYRTTPDGQIIMANPSTVRILGYDSYDELSRRNLEQEGFETTYSRNEFKQKMKEAGFVIGLESTWRDQKGNLKNIRENAWAVYDANGEIAYYDGVIEDITEKKIIETELKKNKERLSLALESAGLGLWDQDFKTGTVYRNEIWTRMLGYEPEEVEDKVDFFVNLIHPDDLAEFHEKCRLAESGEDPKFAVEQRVKAKDGSWKWIYNWGRIVDRDAEGNPLRSVGTHLDITHIKKTEDELRQHQEHTKLINSILRHDIANTFAVIRSALNIYRRNNRAEMLDEADLQIKKGVNLIHRMRRLEEYFEMIPRMMICNLADVIHETAFSYFEMKTNIFGEAKVKVDDALPSVFDNLFSNALKHGNATEINVHIFQNKGICKVEFCDNGTGISDKIKAKIFDKAFKSGSHGNTGLGLYIVKKTISRYGGQIRVEDNQPCGAKFII